MANGQPVPGSHTPGENTYSQVIAKATGNRRYTNLTAFCKTNPAMLSLDGGDANHIPLMAGQQLVLPDLDFVGPVSAKNLTADSSYEDLNVSVW